MAMSATYITINGVLMMETRDGVDTAYVHDTLGNLIECRDVSGTKTYEAWYWPYGEVRTSTGTNPSPWGFVGCLGYYTDKAIGLYVRARNLRVDLMRWTTVDPLWPREQAYGYARQTPNFRFDPSGLGPVGVMGPPYLDPVTAGFAASAAGLLGISLSELLVILGLVCALYITKLMLCKALARLVHRICPDNRKGPSEVTGKCEKEKDTCMTLFYKMIAWDRCAAIRNIVMFSCGDVLGFSGVDAEHFKQWQIANQNAFDCKVYFYFFCKRFIPLI